MWSLVTCLTAYSLSTALEDNPVVAIVFASLISTFAVAFIFLYIRRRRAASARAAAAAARTED